MSTVTTKLKKQFPNSLKDLEVTERSRKGAVKPGEPPQSFFDEGKTFIL
jgi:hypothetical protein